MLFWPDWMHGRSDLTLSNCTLSDFTLVTCVVNIHTMKMNIFRCGPCRQFTPELTAFYQKMNQRRGKKDQFEIVWISRCRDTNAYGQYFAQMGNWLALPPEEAMGERGVWLGNKYKVKGIPTLVLLDDSGVSGVYRVLYDMLHVNLLVPNLFPLFRMSLRATEETKFHRTRRVLDFLGGIRWQLCT